METIILVIHLMIALAMIGIILIQRSEGGGLGLGGGAGGMGQFMSVRGTANILTRATAILAACFIGTSLTLAILAGQRSGPNEIVAEETEQVEPPVETESPIVPDTD